MSADRRDTPPAEKPTKAYYVEESVRGTTSWLVYANTAKEARRTFLDGEAIDRDIHPNGVRSVRRAPEEDERA